MKDNGIAIHAIGRYQADLHKELVSASKTVRRLKPKRIPWLENLLDDAARSRILYFKLFNGDYLLEIYPAPTPEYLMKTKMNEVYGISSKGEII